MSGTVGAGRKKGCGRVPCGSRSPSDTLRTQCNITEGKTRASKCIHGRRWGRAIVIGVVLWVQLTEFRLLSWGRSRGGFRRHGSNRDGAEPCTHKPGYVGSVEKWHTQWVTAKEAQGTSKASEHGGLRCKVSRAKVPPIASNAHAQAVHSVGGGFSRGSACACRVVGPQSLSVTTAGMSTATPTIR